MNRFRWYGQYWKRLLKKDRGEINMVAIVLILLVVIVLAGIFRESITNLLSNLLDKIQKEAMQI